MQILFESRDPQANELRDLVQRRIRFMFRRIGWLVPKAKVLLSDVNGPRGGIDKRCQVEIRSDVAGSLVVASVARDWRTALDKALERAARFLMRQWQRGNDTRRLRQLAITLDRGAAEPLLTKQQQAHRQKSESTDRRGRISR